MNYHIQRYEGNTLVTVTNLITGAIYKGRVERGKAISSRALDCQIIAKALREEKGGK